LASGWTRSIGANVKSELGSDAAVAGVKSYVSLIKSLRSLRRSGLLPDINLRFDSQ